MPVAAKYSNFEPAISRFRGSEAALKRLRGEGGKYGQDHQTATGSDSLGALGQRVGELAEANAWASLLRPAQAQRGDTYDLGTIAASLNGITRALQGLDEQASNIGRGICQNRKLR
jgi:hypothetical protein